MSRTIIHRRTDLTSNLLELCRYLRHNGFNIGPLETSLMLDALAIIAPFDDPIAFRNCLKATLCRKRLEQERFDALYDQYWKELEKALDAKRIDQEQSKPKKGGKEGFQQIKDWLQGNTNEEITEAATYSEHQSLGEKDFSKMDEEELREAWKIIQLIARSMARQASRRWERTHRRKRLDLKQTIRQNLRTGGEIMDIYYKKTKKNRHKIVLLCDISKSMDLYSKFLLQFIYTFQNVDKKIESFVFSTNLHRVTNTLKNQEFKNSLENLLQTVPEWSGGTRIGESLHQFISDYGCLVNNRTTVILLSDGWDTGNVHLLEASMQKIHRRAARTIWLNPLAGNAYFKPEVEGMKRALPYIDIFSSGHNLESLKQLAGRVRNKQR